MKRELQIHLLPLLAIFLFTNLFWALNQVAIHHFIFLFFGLLFGSFLLDSDHLIYWFFINPKSEESQLAHQAFQKKDWLSLFRLLENTHRQHTNLVFHHYFFQIVLLLISLFVFTSSSSTFTLALLLAANLHLLIDEINDFYTDKTHLQNWLFAREKKQLPLAYLGRYIFTFSLTIPFFLFLLIRLPL